MLPPLLVLVAFVLGFVLGRRSGMIAVAVIWLFVFAVASVLTQGVFPAEIRALGWDGVAFIYGSVVASFAATVAGSWIRKTRRR